MRTIIYLQLTYGNKKTLTSLAPLSLLFQCKEGVLRVKIFLSTNIFFKPYLNPFHMGQPNKLGEHNL